MRKFKKGDRVKVVNAACAKEMLAFVKNGDVGTVVSKEEVGDCEVKIDGQKHLLCPWWLPREALELIAVTKGE